MALKIDTTYTETVPGDTDYPQGSWKNVTSPGGVDGTPYEKQWPNDIYGLLQRLLSQANVSPSQVSDTVPLSDYMDSLQKIFPLWLTYSDTGTADNYQLASITGSTVNEYTDGMVVIFRPLNTNTGASVVQIESLGTRPVTYYDGTPLQSGVLLAARHAQLVYDNSNSRFNVVGVDPSVSLVGGNNISGLVPRNSGADVDHDMVFGTGAARAANASIDIALTGELIKQLDAPWAVGNDAGGRFSGTLDIDQTNHLYLISKSSTGEVDCGCSTLIDPTPELPSGYDVYKRVFSIKTDGSGNIRPFRAYEIAGGALDVDYLPRFVAESFTGSVPVGRQTFTLDVPAGISPLVKMSASLEHDTTTTKYILVMSTDEILTPDNQAYTVEINSGNTGDTTQFECFADTNGQVAWHAKPDGFAVAETNIILKGYLDRRVN
jgi:hypothetical protein